MSTGVKEIVIDEETAIDAARLMMLKRIQLMIVDRLKGTMSVVSKFLDNNASDTNRWELIKDKIRSASTIEQLDAIMHHVKEIDETLTKNLEVLGRNLTEMTELFCTKVLATPLQ